MMRRLLLSTSLCALLIAGPALGQDTRYRAWSDPDSVGSSGQSQGFVEDLRKLVSEAEKAQAADPLFLQDLKALANKYDPVTLRLIVDETFKDGDFTRNPVWQLARGEYWIEKGYGLRSAVTKAQAQTSGNNTGGSRQLSGEEVVIGILGAVLGAKTGGSSSGGTQQDATKAGEPAEIYLAQEIPNTFAIEISVTSWKTTGDLTIGAYQGADRQSGYHLHYRAGQTPALQLVRKYGDRTSVIADVKDAEINDQKTHSLLWTRKPGGMMSLSLDGKVVLETQDQGFRDSFQGLMLLNNDGDFTFSSVKISGR